MENDVMDARAIIGKELAVQDVNDVRIAKMREEFMPLVITDLKDGKQYAAVHGARMEVRDSRILVQKVSKKTRDKAIVFQKDCIAEEKRLVGLIEPIEAHLQAEEDKVDNEKARLKAEADAKEAARLQARVDTICDFGAVFNGQTYTAYGLQIPVALVKTCTDDQFKQFVAQIQEKVDAEQVRITAELQAKKAEEDVRKAEAQRLKMIELDQELERVRLTEIAHNQEVAAQKIKDDQAFIETEKKRIAAAEARRLKDIEDEKIRVEDEKKRSEELEKVRKESAEKAVRDAEAKRLKDETDKAEKERLAKVTAEKKEARRPDKEKLLKLADAFTPIPPMVLKTIEGKNILALFEVDLARTVKALRDRTEAL